MALPSLPGRGSKRTPASAGAHPLPGVRSLHGTRPIPLGRCETERICPKVHQIPSVLGNRPLHRCPPPGARIPAGCWGGGGMCRPWGMLKASGPG